MYSAFNYTSERPRVVGYYWCKYAEPSFGVLYETVVRVYCSEGGEPPDTVFWDGGDFSISDARFFAFAGPIPPPSGGWADGVLRGDHA
jgi:hypothetical protein